MKRAIIFSIFVVLLSVSVYAGSCTDSDNGPVNLRDVASFLIAAGKTTDQFGSHGDVCLSYELSNKKVAEGPWLREYYCVGGLSMHKDFKCADFEFQNCVSDDKGSYCKTNKPVEKSSAKTVAVEKKPVVDFYCGDKVMNRADAECYPPGKLCVKDKLAGQCSSNCKCAIVGKKQAEMQSSEAVSSVSSEKEIAKTSSNSEASLEIKVPEQKGVSTTPPAKEENKVEAESPIKKTVTLKVISAIASGVKGLWFKITGLF